LLDVSLQLYLWFLIFTHNFYHYISLLCCTKYRGVTIPMKTTKIYFQWQFMYQYICSFKDFRYKQSTNIIKTIHQYHQNNPPISSKQATNIIKTSNQYHQNNPPISSKQSTSLLFTLYIRFLKHKTFQWVDGYSNYH
jgi:uncharacterized protein YneF (UPF0154 family)